MTDPISEIDSLVRSILQRPTMYSSSPESFEESLFLLESLRQRFTAAGASPQEGEFTNYLIGKGYNAMSLGQIAESKGLRSKEEKFRFIASSWDEFLSSARRSL